MIGQKRLLADIERIKDRFPRFSIILGEKGCGKHLICEYISKILNAPIYLSGLKMEDIRETLSRCYNQTSPTIFVLPNADNMNVMAKNCLLKITEEPPKNAYFIITLQSIDNTLTTIKSRGTVFKLDSYSLDELLEYRKFKKYSEGYDKILSELCTTTGDVDELFTYDIKDFYNFASIIADNIHIPKNGNAFKITTKLKVKESDKGFDPYMMLKTVQVRFLEKFKNTNKKQYLKAIRETGVAMQSLKIPTVNKLSTLDMWIINVRGALVGV